MAISLVFAAWVLLFCTDLVAAEDGGSLVFSKVDRMIDLAMPPAIRCAATIKLVNEGSSSVSSFLIAFPSSQSSHLADYRVTLARQKGTAVKGTILLDIQPSSPPDLPDSPPPDTSFYTVSLSTPLAPSSSATLTFAYILTGSLTPFPAEIGQAEPQFLLFKDSHYFYSPYTVKSQTTTIRLPQPSVESYTKLEPCTLSGETLKLGPYPAVAPYSLSPMDVHYEHNRALVVADSLLREIEISHWGNIYVTESYRIRHAGAKHKGGFSRLDYSAKPHEVGASSTRSMRTLLPPSARSLYYRDEIGNISDSRLIFHPRNVHMDIEPRFPILGGWTVSFIIGYSVPLEDFVFSLPDGRKMLNFTFGSGFMDMVVADCQVKVVLPEGASGLDTSVPFSAELTHEGKYSYLDTFGRLVVLLKKKNVVAEVGNMHFQVFYSYPALVQLGKPLVLTAVFFLFFSLAMAYVRLDLTISRHTSAFQAKVHEEEVEGALHHLRAVLARRAALYGKLDAALQALSRSGKVALARAARKAAEKGLGDGAEEVKDIVGQLEAVRPAVAILPKVQAVARKDKECEAQLLEKHERMVEAYEAELPGAEIDERVAVIQQRYLALRAQVKDLVLTLQD